MKDCKGRPILAIDVDFRALRRTCATLFGGYARDPKTTQAQLRHADPTVTLKHYQKSIAAAVKEAGDQLDHRAFATTSGLRSPRAGGSSRARVPGIFASTQGLRESGPQGVIRCFSRSPC